MPTQNDQSEPPQETILRCSFCNKSQRDVWKLVAGPAVRICNECVEICVDVLDRDVILEPGSKAGPDSVPAVTAPRSTLAPLSCALCHTRTPAENAILFPDRGWICSSCMVVIELYLDSRGSEP
jgi:hypothetical protein